jgi:hypothetical protein
MAVLRFIGFLFVIALVIGIFGCGLYVGLWLMLVGGIVGIIEQIKADDIDSLVIALSVVKIMFFALPIWFSFFVATLFGSVGTAIVAGSTETKVRFKYKR